MEESTTAFNEETRAIWDANAAFWDARMGDGNLFQTRLIWPATERLLNLQPGEVVLDIACGNGVSTRKLGQLGAKVVAFDFSEKFIELAKAHNTKYSEQISYRVIDATDEAQLLALGIERFDAAVCNMALMDIADIRPLLSALTRLLRKGGRFVFSVPHPCFNSSAIVKVVEEEDRQGEIVTTCSIKVSKYLNLKQGKLLGMVGQPAFAYWFHRPLHVLFGACFQAGFVLDGLEEPAFEQEDTPGDAFSWVNFHETPPVLVASLRLPR